LQVHDKIISINNKPVHKWDDIENLLFTENLAQTLEIQFIRGNEPQVIKIPQAEIPNMIDERLGIMPVGLVPVIGVVDNGKPAAKAGMVAGDTILAVNGNPVHFGGLSEIIQKNAGKEITITWKHQNEIKEARVTPTEEGRIGVMLEMGYTGPQVHEKYGLFEALPISIREVYGTTKLFLVNISQIIVGKVSFSKSVGGPIKIAQLANRSAESGAVPFLGFVALLSVSLALLNILPFPGLDGGHLMFVLFEAIFRRPVPDKVKIALQQVGITLLLVLMVFVIYNDIVNF
jgi:regulator of sigma E protease